MKVKGSTRSTPTDPVEPDRTSENVRLAQDGEKAWAALGTVEVPLSPIRRQVNDEATAVDHKIAKGWKVLAEWERDGGTPPPAEWVERLVELHGEQLDLLFQLDQVRVLEAEALALDVGTLCAAVLSRACVAAEAYLGPTVSDWDGTTAFERMLEAVDRDDAGAALAAGKDYVAAAVRRRYSGEAE